MSTPILESIASAFGNEIVSEIKALASGLTDETIQIFNRNIKKYFKTQIALYKNVKNILYGSNPIDIYQFYLPLKIKPPKTIEWHTDTSSVSSVFCRTNYITLIGEAGCGKTTLTKYLFLNCLQTKFGIPVYIELRNLNNTKVSFIEYLKEKILYSRVVENENIYERLLEKGRFVFFIDGYDELNHDIKSDVTSNLIKFVEKYSENKFLVTSRPHSNAEGIALFNNYHILPLDSKQVKMFIDIQLKNEKEISEKIKNSVIEAQKRGIGEFLSNPLLLSIYILIFARNSDIPQSKHIFYRRVVQTLFIEHDSVSKSGYIRQLRTNLTQEQIEEILKKISFVSYFNSKFNFTLDYLIPLLNIIKEKSIDIKFENNKIIEDLKSISIWVEDSGIISFNHRSIQEYYAAVYISELDTEMKTKIYTKIRNDILENQVGEIEHLLNLCKELDEIDYLKFFYIPVIAKFISQIETTTYQQLIKTLVPYLCKFLYRDSTYAIIQSHPYLRLPNLSYSSEYSCIIELLKIEIENLNKKGILKDFWESNKTKRRDRSIGNASKTYINLFEEFPIELLEYFEDRKEFVLELSNFSKKLHLSYEIFKDYIDKERENSKDIIAMI